jgi:hypothetical protein
MMQTPSYIMSYLMVASRPFFLSARVERYAALISGLIIITVTCKVWRFLQFATTDVGIWTGPNDLYLHHYRPATAWLWQHDPSGIALQALAVTSIIALGPFTFSRWRSRSWPMLLWGIVTLAFCGAYVLIGFQLMLLPLGRFR